MNTFENSANKSQADLTQTQQAMLGDIKKFFQTDSCAEIVSSMNSLLEALLFCKDLGNVTPEMRVDIANQLRAVTLLSRLNEGNVRSIPELSC